MASKLTTAAGAPAPDNQNTMTAGLRGPVLLQGEWREQPDFREPPLKIDGDGDHWNHSVDGDYFSQPGALFRLMNPAQQQALFDNTARAMGDAPDMIKQRHIDNCAKAEPAMAPASPRRSAST